MNVRGFLIGLTASAMLLTGCAAASNPVPTSATGTAQTHAPSPTSSAPGGSALVDPAPYPLPSEELSEGMNGVMFTAGSNGLQCAIFDPLSTSDTHASPPEFGCEVSVVGYPYPPLVGGPSDSANAFLSWSHLTAVAANVTDASYSGDTPAPALPAGSSIAWGTVTCTALAADEVRCVDATSGHGMRVSVRDYDLF